MKVSAQSSSTLPSKLQPLPLRSLSYRHHSPSAGAALEERRVSWFTQSSWTIRTALSRYLSRRFLHLFALISHLQKWLNSPQNYWLISVPRVFLRLMHRETLTPPLLFSMRAGTPRLPDEHKRSAKFSMHMHEETGFGTFLRGGWGN